MYEAIKSNIYHEFDVGKEEFTSISDAYEILYRLVIRLSDMDDFDNQILRSIQEKITDGASFETAFKSTINNEYQFADFDYFHDSFNHFKSTLEEDFNKAITNVNPARSWNASINWLTSHAVINVNGDDYTLKQLQKEINKGDEDYE